MIFFQPVTQFQTQRTHTHQTRPKTQTTLTQRTSIQIIQFYTSNLKEKVRIKI